MSPSLLGATPWRTWMLPCSSAWTVTYSCSVMITQVCGRYARTIPPIRNPPRACLSRASPCAARSRTSPSIQDIIVMRAEGVKRASVGGLKVDRPRLLSNTRGSGAPWMPELKTNVIYRGDCTNLLANHVPDGTIDLIYVDPPFFSNEQYEVLWRNGYEMRAFEDRWKGGIENYISWMEPKLRECYRVLKTTGTFYLHCDWHANYRLRMMLDEIFGLSHFQNEIIWKRTTAHVDTHGFGHVHDTILRYTKSDEFTWNPDYRPYSQEYTDQYFKYKDEYFEQRGPFWTGDITGAGLRHGETGEKWHGIDPLKIGKGRHWIRTPKELEQLDADGRIFWPKKGGGIPKFKRYLKEQPGLPLDSVWDDIPSLGGLMGDA